jgi:hypothetical protein
VWLLFTSSENNCYASVFFSFALSLLATSRSFALKGVTCIPEVKWHHAGFSYRLKVMAVLQILYLQGSWEFDGRPSAGQSF